MPRPPKYDDYGEPIFREKEFDKPLPRVKAVPPQYAFKTVQEFAEAHREGTHAEFEFERWEIGKFNEDESIFRAWPITAKLGAPPVTWLLLVAPGPKDALLPKDSETCRVMVFTTPEYDDYNESISKSSATRVENPCAAWGIKDPFWQSCMAFEISLWCNDSTAPIPDPKVNPSYYAWVTLKEKLKADPSYYEWASLKKELDATTSHTPPKDSSSHSDWDSLLRDLATLPADTLTPALSTNKFNEEFHVIPRNNSSQLSVVFELRLSLSTHSAETSALSTLLHARAQRDRAEPSVWGAKAPAPIASLESEALTKWGSPRDHATLARELEYLARLESQARDAADTAAKFAKQIDAFEYFVTLEYKQTSSLFDVFPHMADPMFHPAKVPKVLMDRFSKFNPQQKGAYRLLLGNIPDGICMVPGGPGAGKTFWNLTVAAALQSKDVIKKPGETLPSVSRNKVLYLLDMNRPLTDVANKMVQVYQDLGLTKYCCDDCGTTQPRSVVRMFCWSYEQNRPTQGYITVQRQELDNRRARLAQKQPAVDEKNGPLAEYKKVQKGKRDDTARVELQGFAASFFRLMENSTNPRQKLPQGQDCFAKTLDEAAAEFYERHRDTKYADVRELLHLPSADLKELRDSLIERVYRDTLKHADFIATTPVTASKFSGALFEPELVIFDEAPHARDLSLLISVAAFKPEAWLLTGDHRQTQAFAKSEGTNKYFNHLRLSVMERAYRKNPDMPALLINHRAHGNLQELASLLFYRSKMRPAIDPCQPGAIPVQTLYLRKEYIMPMKDYEGPEVSRLLIVLDKCGTSATIQKSWEHEGHRRWVMKLIRELTTDGCFEQINSNEPGTILVMSPYKLAFTEYGRAIRRMSRDGYGGLGGHTVEARTIDTAQGHEADVCILDFVRDDCTKHLEDAHRMCVALTRARQLEFVLMTAGMVRNVERRPQQFPTMAKMIAYCKSEGQYVRGPNVNWDSD